MVVDEVVFVVAEEVVVVQDGAPLADGAFLLLVAIGEATTTLSAALVPMVIPTTAGLPRP